ncbi:MAG: dynamin family protein [Rhodoferax sp.]|nr:dynamin family protein [Rhodoferax sp.]
MKTPKQLRSDIQTLTTHLSQVQVGLQGRANIKGARIGKECKRTADALGALLKDMQVPDTYKVAVVGRFKAGKSFFVNELLGIRLSSEGTLPETAAVTTFRYGTEVRASIRFLRAQTWHELKQLYAQDERNVDAQRVRNWFELSKQKKPKDKDGVPLPAAPLPDLTALEREFITEQGKVVERHLAAGATKKATIEFQRVLKEYTSSGSPLHCLVDSIELQAPSEILAQGVELIDTPGLGDTERFRVTLTEQTVAGVDAVLFLTKSGPAYDQSEKEFLLSLLRKGTVRQLIVVITQFDETYTKVIKEATDDDEEPTPIEHCIARERLRIEAAIAVTLKDLAQDESLQRYQEQLGDVPIVFTSARLHRDANENRGLPFQMHPQDPGGVRDLHRRLLTLLSSESRLAQTAENLVHGARTILLDLQSVMQARLYALNNTPNKEVAEQKLHTFRQEFGQAGQRFAGAVEQQVQLLSTRLAEQTQHDATMLEFIGVLAEQPLRDFESSDMGRHWRTRRSGYWGYMTGLQGQVANQVFPKVQQLLTEHTNLFGQYAAQFEAQLIKLAKESERITTQLDMGAGVPLDVTGRLRTSLKRTFERAQEKMAAEELKVLQLLEDFVNDEVSDQITNCRRAVAEIWDRGTVDRQNIAVKGFYSEVRGMLRKALLDYLGDSKKGFDDFLLEESKAAPRDALDDVQLLLEQTSDHILSATTEHLAEMAESAQALIAQIDAEVVQVLDLTQSLAFVPTEKLKPVAATPVVPTVKPTAHLDTADAAPNGSNDVAASALAALPLISGTDWSAQVRTQATVMVKRLQLIENATGWPLERLFEPRFLQGSLRLSLVDPYLHTVNQLRNFNEFLVHVAECAHPKEMEVVTTQAPAELLERQTHDFAAATRDMFDQFGVALTIRFDIGLHDRWLATDHGVLFKLGRGLYVYKPATGLAAHRPALRRVRATENDVFVVPGHALV